jgi:hypothetical protein
MNRKKLFNIEKKIKMFFLRKVCVYIIDNKDDFIKFKDNDFLNIFVLRSGVAYDDFR